MTRGERNLLIATILFVAIVAAAAWWWNAINAMPVVNIPTPVMPNPNARDFYIRACNLPVKGALESDTINKAFENGRIIPGPPHRAGWSPAKEDYAYPVGGVPKNAASTSPLAPLHGGTPPKHIPDPITLGDVQQTLALKAGRLALLRQGFDYQYFNPPVRSFNALFPELSQFREMARLLAAEASYQAASNDYAGSVNTSLDTLKFGSDVPRGGALISDLVGIVIETIGRIDVWGRIQHLKAAQARAATHRLEAIIPQHYSYAETLREEKYSEQAGLLELFRRPRKEWMGDTADCIQGFSEKFSLITLRTPVTIT